jgi:WD40 repeat protein
MRTVLITLVTALVTTSGAGGCGDLQQWGAEGIAYTATGELVAILDKQVRFFDTDAQHELGSMKTESQSGGWVPLAGRFSMSSDGRTLAVAAGRELEVYDMPTRKLVTRIVVSDDLEEPSPVAGLALSPDGSLVAVSARPYGLGKASRLAVWRISDQSVVTEIGQAAGRESWGWSAGVAFSPDASHLYGVAQGYDEDGNFVAHLTAWTIPGGAVGWETVVTDPNAPSPFPPNGAPITSLALSPDGASLATGGLALRLFRASDGMPQDVVSREPFADYLGSLNFSPDGQRLVASHYTNSMPDPMVFGLDGSLLQSFPVEHSGCAESVYSPDGTRIAGACNPWVKVWDAATGEMIRKIEVTVPIY